MADRTESEIVDAIRIACRGTFSALVQSAAKAEIDTGAPALAALEAEFRQHLWMGRRIIETSGRDEGGVGNG